MKLSERKRLFASPANEMRAIPFWSWNGKLEKKELFRQIDIMKEMGFGGFFMHSRTGLATEYLGDEWFEMINACADYGAEKGMEAWLYDEDRWPSGSAGGMVTVHEEYRARFLEMMDPEQACGDIAAVFAVRLEGECLTGYRMLDSIDDALEDGEKPICFKVVTAELSDNYNGTCYVDTMNREAIDCFIELTHEKYREKCGERLGTVIQGIFTDEPHRGPCFTPFSGGKETRIPYTAKLFEEFSARCGYDLKAKLPEVFFRMKGEPISRVTRDYFEVTQQLFIENFAIPCLEWCHKNKISVTGHVLHEDSLCSQATMQGSLMRYYEYMDVPGMDLLGEHNTCHWVAKQLESVTRQMGQKRVLSELDGCTGWQMNFQSYKNIGDWQALFGINLRCPHLSWYTMKGEAKRDYPASILHQSGWYADYREIEDYYARIHAALTDAQPECDLLVINPIESVWSRAYAGCFEWLDARDEGIAELERMYRYVFRALNENRIDFDYGEEDILARHASVHDGKIMVGKASYKKVLVAGVDTLRASTVSLLKEFAANGGTVVFSGIVPAYVDALPSEEVRMLAKECKVIELDTEAIAKACMGAGDVEVIGENADRVYAQSWKVDGGRLVMLLNMDRKNALEGLKLDVADGCVAERWDPRSGEIRQIELRDNGFMFDIERGGERIFFIAQDSDAPKCEGTAECEGTVIELPESFRYELNEQNLCVLDFTEVIVNGSERIERQEVLKADRALRDLLGIPYRGGEMLQPWYDAKYNAGDTKLLATVRLTFEVKIDHLPKNTELVLEDLPNVTSVAVNGKEVSLISTGKWVDICFDRVNVEAALWKTGINIVTVDMKYFKTSGIEAVYLKGDFGVRLENGRIPVITDLPEKLTIGDITDQGLPFYSGSVKYLLDEPINGRCVISADCFEGALVCANGDTREAMSFAPYETELNGLKSVEVVLTRRNTFGPLHQVPKIAKSYGPESFMSKGANWSEEYQLLKQGLTAKPSVKQMNTKN